MGNQSYLMAIDYAICAIETFKFWQTAIFEKTY